MAAGVGISDQFTLTGVVAVRRLFQAQVKVSLRRDLSAAGRTLQ
jgi:hypothetical protein